jgi:hypothetical protein
MIVPVDGTADCAESEKAGVEDGQQKQNYQEPLMPFELFHSVVTIISSTKNETCALAVTITC